MRLSKHGRKLHSCLIFFMAIQLVFSSCQQSEESTTIESMEMKKFFDLKGYFEKQAVEMGTGRFKKTVSVNATQEVKTLDTLDLRKELSVFMQSDINRPAWSDKYSVDSVKTVGSALAQLKYTALDEKMKTRLITIFFSEEGDVKQVRIENATTSVVADSRQFLDYQSSVGYSIESKQKVILSDSIHLKSEVKFLPE